MRVLFTLSLALLSGCFEKNEYGYKPDDDQFILKHFEYLLSQTDIKYKKGGDGFYYASELDIERTLKPLGKKASIIGLHTSNLEVEKGCSLNLLKDHLDSQKIIYHVHDKNSKTVVQTTYYESKNSNIVGYYVKFKRECQ